MKKRDQKRYEKASLCLTHFKNYLSDLTYISFFVSRFVWFLFSWRVGKFRCGFRCAATIIIHFFLKKNWFEIFHMIISCYEVFNNFKVFSVFQIVSVFFQFIKSFFKKLSISSILAIFLLGTFFFSNTNCAFN